MSPWTIWLTVQLLLVAALAFERVLPRAAPHPALLRARTLLFVAVVGPIAFTLAPAGDRAEVVSLVPPQVWSTADAVVRPLTSAASALPSTATPDVLAWTGLLLLPGAVWGALQVAAAVRLARRARRLHTVGRVTLSLGSAAFALRWPGRVLVVVRQEMLGDHETRRAVLRHEAAHHRHGDPVWAWALLLARAACWPNPAIHTWFRRLSAWEELAADEAAARPDRLGYARLLYAQSKLSPRATGVTTPSLTLAMSQSMLSRRILTLLQPTPSSSRARVALTTLLGTLALVSVLPFGAAVAAGPGGPSPAPTVAAANRRDGATDPFPLELAAPVQVALDRMLTEPRRRSWIQGALAERNGWADLVDDALERAGLPPELAAVPLVESGYTNWGAPAAPASASLAPGTPGRGLWMFIVPTARSYGLRVDEPGQGAVDERLDPVKETNAAVALLSDLYLRYGDWRLALAGYNQGQRAVDAAVASQGTRDPWRLVEAGALNDYVPQVMAAAILLEDPSLLGD